MVVDIRVVGVVPDGGFKVTERAGSIACTDSYVSGRGQTGERSGLAHFHVDTGNLDERLDIVRNKIQTLLQIFLGTSGITQQEPTRRCQYRFKLSVEPNSLVGTTHVQSLCLALLPVGGDALLQCFVDEHECLGVVSGFLGVERKRERVIARVGRVSGQGGELGLQAYRQGEYE